MSKKGGPQPSQQEMAQRMASVLAADPPKPVHPFLAPAPEWWTGPAAADLSPPFEVDVRTLPPGQPVTERLSLQPVDDAPEIKVVAAKPYSPGDIVASELAVAYVPAGEMQKLLAVLGEEQGAPGAGGAGEPSTAPVNKDAALQALVKTVRFTGPWGSSPKGHAAVVRFAAQLPPFNVNVREASAAEGVGSANRTEVIVSALRSNGIYCGDFAGNPYSETTPGSAGRVPVFAIFVRASAWRHSCGANCDVRSVWDSTANAPAVQVFATKAIAAGEELTLSRVDPLQTQPLRAWQLDWARGRTVGCSCPRCTAADDDAISVRCPACVEGRMALQAAAEDGATSGEGSEEALRQAVCSSCGWPAKPPSDPDTASRLPTSMNEPMLRSMRLSILKPFMGGGPITFDVTGPGGEEAVTASVAAFINLQKVLHDTDAGAWKVMHGLLPALARVRGAGSSTAGEGEGAAAAASSAATGEVSLSVTALPTAAALSARLLSAAQSMPFFPQHRLLDIAFQHGVLCGACENPTEGKVGLDIAARIARTYLASNAPHVVELFEALAKNPPKNKKEAATADRLRLMGLAM